MSDNFGAFLCVLVIYNCSLNESKAYISIKKIVDHHIKLVIVDNSTIFDLKCYNKKKCHNECDQYIDMQGNCGLSKAYNSVLVTIEDFNNTDLIIWFDADTTISQDYFNKLKRTSVDNKDTEIFAPIVQGQNGKFYSPNEACFIKNKQMKYIGDNINMKKFNAINSGLAVRQCVYSDYRYDERLFLDQIDQNFFDIQRSKKRKFVVIDTVIQQNFSQRNSDIVAENAWLRLELRICDYIKYSKLKNNPIYIFLGFAKCFGLGIQFAIKVRMFEYILKSFGLCLKMTISKE